MRKSLVAFDTNHIKSYVFGTDRLKEVRGASALLDKLNREGMIRQIERLQQNLQGKIQIQFDMIYVNGGSGLFVITEEEIATDNTDQMSIAEMFGQAVRQAYQRETQGGASITYIVYKLPEDLPDHIEELKKVNLRAEFEMVHYLLREAKSNPPYLGTIRLATHPFFRACDSCGINYAEKRVVPDPNDPDDENDQGGLYCSVCYNKQREDTKVKDWLGDVGKKVKANTPSEFLAKQAINAKNINDKNLWARILYYLNKEQYDFEFSPEERMGFPKRPKDFNVFRDFVQGKEYVGLIYADANNMGIRFEGLDTLKKQAEFAAEIDKAIHVAMSKAIKKHLPLPPPAKRKGNGKLFPFDILLLGGDDMVMVTDAAKAMDVAYTIAKEFYQYTEASTIIDVSKVACTLSIGVVLAPIKYPFSLLLDMADDALRAAKKGSMQARANVRGKIDDSRINFVVVTGGSIKDFNSVDKNYRSNDGKNDFHATLRPYDLDGLERLLTAIKEGHKRNLGRTKLHALREAVLEKNLTTSVSNGLAVLRNWRQDQRDFVLKSLYEFGIRAIPKSNIKDPVNGFPRVTFPWFLDPQANQKTDKKAAREVYRTTFLDFVELYDFVAREDGNVHDAN